MHAQTAWIFCARLSSGLVVRVREFFGAESLSQRYFFVADLKEQFPELEIIVHDDACHLHKFACARASSSTRAAEIAPDSVRYVCDGFHVSGHTDPWCLANCHPQAPPFEDRMKDIRTSVCEFTFAWLSRYRHQTKHMSEFGFKWFLLEIIATHNTFVMQQDLDHLPKVIRRDD